MDEKSITLFMEMFLRPAYSVEDAIKVFGSVQDTSLPNWIILKPMTDDLETVKLEYLELEEDTSKKTFLASVFIRYIEPVLISFSKMTQTYDDPEELIRLKPDGDIPYRFKVKNNILDGDVILFVKGLSEKDKQPVRGIKFTRYPPEKK